MKSFRLASYLILVALPLYGIRFSFLEQPTNALELLVVIILLAYFVIPAQAGIHFRKDGSPTKSGMTAGWVVPGTILLIAATISLFVSPNHAEAFASYREYYIEPMLFFVMLANEFHGIEDVKKLLIAIALPTIPLAAIAFAQHFNLYPIPAAYLADHRSTSLYSYANAVGLYFAPIIAALAALVITTKLERSKKIAIAILISVLAISIFFSQTEAAYLALIGTALVAGFSSKKFRRTTLGVVVIGMLILATHLSLAQTVIGKLTLQDFSGAVRRTIWAETSGMLKDHWLFGAGLAGYQTVMAPYHLQKDIEIFWFPHDIILNIWVELGLLGLVAFALIVRRLRSTRSWLVIAPLLVMTIHGLFDVPFFKPDLALLTAAFLAMSVMLYVETP